MGEYIKREAAQAEIRKGTVVPDDAFGMGVMSGMGTALLRIEAIPAVDAVEVVRCKDCKYSAEIREYGCYCRKVDAPWFNDTFEVYMDLDDFCSYGERKEDA